MRSEFLITNYQIRNNKIIVFEQWHGPRRNKQINITRSQNLKEQRKKAYSGTLSKAGKKRMEKAITLLCQASPRKMIYNPIIKKHHNHKLSFITLTVADNTKNITSAECYKTCLRPFLQWLVKYRGVKLYVWKAELQSRGQIHYHITTPNYIHWQEIKDKWNYLQKKAGYLDNYYKQHNHYNPNSTDIHSMRHINDAAAYLTKYFSKEAEKETTDDEENKPEKQRHKGKTWDCSAILKKANYFQTEESNELLDNIKEATSRNQCYAVTFDRFTIIFFNKIKPEHILPLHSRMKFQAYLNYIKSQGGLELKTQHAA